MFGLFDKKEIGSVVVIPDEPCFECKIETPQFKDGKVHYMKTQRGIFDKTTKLFTHTDFDGHDVQFHSMDNLKKALIAVYKI